jgi:hypothetical protein
MVFRAMDKGVATIPSGAAFPLSVSSDGWRRIGKKRKPNVPGAPMPAPQSFAHSDSIPGVLSRAPPGKIWLFTCNPGNVSIIGPIMCALFLRANANSKMDAQSTFHDKVAAAEESHRQRMILRTNPRGSRVLPYVRNRRMVSKRFQGLSSGDGFCRWVLRASSGREHQDEVFGDRHGVADPRTTLPKVSRPHFDSLSQLTLPAVQCEFSLR